MSRSCVFCNIIHNRIEAHVVYEDDMVIAFLDNDPINNGHVLVVPKAHKLDIDDLSDDELHRITSVCNMLVKALKRTFKTDGYSIMQNGGAFNEIGHFHMHVFPRYIGDGFGWLDNHIELRDMADILRELKMNLTNR